MRIGVPWTDEEPVDYLIEPEFPHVVKTELLRPDTYHSPSIEQDDTEHYDVKHVLGAQAEAFLDGPKAKYADKLGNDADDEEVSKC